MEAIANPEQVRRFFNVSNDTFESKLGKFGMVVREGILRVGIKDEQSLKRFLAAGQWRTLRGVGPIMGKRLCEEFQVAFRGKIPVSLPEEIKAQQIDRKKNLAEKLILRFKPYEFALTQQAGIYALKVGDKIKYIGQARFSIMTRIADHVETKPPFTSVEYLEVSNAELNRISEYELALIVHLQPEWNSAGLKRNR